MTNLINIDSKKIVTTTNLSGYMLPEKKVENSYLYSFVIDVKINYTLNGSNSIAVNYGGITYKFLCKKEVKIDNIYKECYLYSPYKINSYQYNETYDTDDYVKNHITYLNILCVPIGEIVNETNFSSKFYLYNLSGNTVYSLINKYNLFKGVLNLKYTLDTFKFYNPIIKYISGLGGIDYGNNTLYSTESSPLISGVENNDGRCFKEKTYYNIFGISKNSTKCVTGSHLDKIKINYIRPLIGSFFTLDDEGECSPVNRKIIDIEAMKDDADYYNYDIFFIAPYVHGYKEFLKDISDFEIKDENIVVDTFLVDSTTNSFITGSTTDIRYDIDTYIESRNTIHFDDYYVRTFSGKTVTIKKDIEDSTQNDIFIDKNYGLIHKYIIEDVYSNIRYSTKNLVGSDNCVIKNVKYGDKIYQGDIMLNRPPVIVPGIVSRETRNESNNIYYYKLSYMDIDTANLQYRDPNTLDEIVIEEDENGNAIIPVKRLKFKLDSKYTTFEKSYSHFFSNYSSTAATLNFSNIFNSAYNEAYLYLCESINSGRGEYRFKQYLDSNDLTETYFGQIITYILSRAFVKVRLTFKNDSTYYYLDCGPNFDKVHNNFVDLNIVSSDSDNYLTASLRGSSSYIIKRSDLTNSIGGSVTVNKSLLDINKLQVYLYFKEEYVGYLKDYFNLSESILVTSFNITG